MTTNNYDYSTEFRNAIRTAIQPWVEWKHISMGKTHCPTCLKLDKCWFVKANMPQLPQHEYCHCTAVPKSTRTVQSQAKTSSPIQKFTEYLFNPDNPKNGGKAELFELWGYDQADSQWMVAESQQQAREKYIAGDYSLGRLDAYGQRIHIQMTIPDKITGEMRVFRTAWMARPNGELVLVTPYGDDK